MMIHPGQQEDRQRLIARLGPDQQLPASTEDLALDLAQAAMLAAPRRLARLGLPRPGLTPDDLTRGRRQGSWRGPPKLSAKEIPVGKVQGTAAERRSQFQPLPESTVLSEKHTRVNTANVCRPCPPSPTTTTASPNTLENAPRLLLPVDDAAAPH